MIVQVVQKIWKSLKMTLIMAFIGLEGQDQTYQVKANAILCLHTKFNYDSLSSSKYMEIT